MNELQKAKQIVAEKYGFKDMATCVSFNSYNSVMDAVISDVAQKYHELMSEWVSVDEPPKENKSIWLYNEKNNHVALGCRVYLNNEGWFWALSNGSIYAIENEIIVESDIDDDYEFTHWKYVTELPTPPNK